MNKKTLNRCPWCKDDPLYVAYHDKEWGKPVFDDRKLFEMLILEGMQAGLSWITILRKRDNFNAAFADFDAEKIVRFSSKKIASLMENPGIIRNELKITSVIKNAKGFLQLQKEYDSFANYIWSFVNGKPIINTPRSMSDVPVKTVESDKMSKDLKRRGFNFVGSTICYAYMQAVGMVNDHLVDCFRRNELKTATKNKT